MTPRVGKATSFSRNSQRPGSTTTGRSACLGAAAGSVRFCPIGTRERSGLSPGPTRFDRGRFEKRISRISAYDSRPDNQQKKTARARENAASFQARNAQTVFSARALCKNEHPEPLGSFPWAILQFVFSSRDRSAHLGGNAECRQRSSVTTKDRYNTMSHHIRQARSSLTLAALCLYSGVLGSPALAGDHKHGTSYDLVQGYILQSQAVCTAPAAAVQTTAPTARLASSQSEGNILNLALPTPQVQPSPTVTLQLSPASAQVQTLQLAPAPTQVQTLQLTPAPTQVQTLQLTAAPAQVQTLQLTAAPTQVQTLQLAAAPTQVQTLQLTSQQACVSQCQVATPVQLLIPQHRWCHFFGK